MNPDTQERNISIIAYITFIGMLIAYFLNRDKKYEVATFHIKNMFGLVLMLLSQVAQSYDYLLLFGELLWGLLFFLWLISLIMAVKNEKRAIPWLSEKFQDWFTFLN